MFARELWKSHSRDSRRQAGFLVPVPGAHLGVEVRIGVEAVHERFVVVLHPGVQPLVKHRVAGGKPAFAVLADRGVQAQPGIRVVIEADHERFPDQQQHDPQHIVLPAHPVGEQCGQQGHVEVPDDAQTVQQPEGLRCVISRFLLPFTLDQGIQGTARDVEAVVRGCAVRDIATGYGRQVGLGPEAGEEIGSDGDGRGTATGGLHDLVEPGAGGFAHRGAEPPAQIAGDLLGAQRS